MSITNHSLLTDLRMNNMISQEIRLILADSLSLRNTEFMDFVGSVNGMGSATIKVRKAGLDGYDAAQWAAFSGATEADAVSDTALTDASADVTVKRRALAYAISDLASMTGTGADLDPFRIAESIARTYDGMFADLTAAAITGFSDIETGAAGSTLTVDAFLNALQKLQNKSGKTVPGPYVAVLHPKGYGELQDSIRSESAGVLQFVQPSYEALKAKGSSYKGSYLGCEIYVSSFIENDGVNNYSGLWGPGAIGFATGAPAIVGAAQVMDMDQVSIEFSRDATKALTRVVGHAYLGVSVIDDDRGVILQSAK
jgi:hypothetical protein